MIKIKIFGLPSDCRGAAEDLITSLREVVSKVEGLPGESGQNCFVFFPSDLVQAGLGEELIVEVKIVHDSALRMLSPDLDKFQKVVSCHMVTFAKKNIPQCNLVFVYLVTVRPRSMSIERIKR